jgi:hypothetical protein
MSYRYRGTEPFWTHFYRLTAPQKEVARRAWRIFKTDPFDARLRPHKIHRLSALYGRTIHAVDVEGDLRCVFYVEDDWVVSVDIGTHDVYRG